MRHPLTVGAALQKVRSIEEVELREWITKKDQQNTDNTEISNCYWIS